MNAFLFYLILLGGFAIAVYLAITLIQKLSRAKTIFTTVEAGNTTFIVAGESVKAIWPNIDEHRLSNEKDIDGREWIVHENDEDKIEKRFFGGRPGLIRRTLWERFGIRYLSIFPNQVKVKRFKVSKKDLAEEGDLPKNHVLKDRVIPSPHSPWVSSLLFLVPRPIYLHELELGGDNSSINIVVLAVFQQVIPTLPVFYYKGDFFSLLDAAIQAAVVDFLSRDYTHMVDGKEVTEPLTYFHWLKMKKGNGSPLEQHLYSLNASKEYVDNLNSHDDGGELSKHLKKLVHNPKSEEAISKSFDDEDMSHGIIPRFGWALKSIRVVDWEATPETAELGRAVLEQETRLHEAKGVIEQKKGVAEGINLVADAEARRYKLLLEAQTGEGVDRNLAAANLGQQIRTENIAKAGLGTYVEGGSSASVMVPANAKQEEAKKSEESS